jgi:hypothetical protein
MASGNITVGLSVRWVMSGSFLTLRFPSKVTVPAANVTVASATSQSASKWGLLTKADLPTPEWSCL